MMFVPQVCSSMDMNFKERWSVPDSISKLSDFRNQERIPRVDYVSISHNKHFLEKWYIKSIEFSMKIAIMSPLDDLKNKIHVLMVDAKHVQFMQEYEVKVTFVANLDTGFQVIAEQDADWDELGINPQEFE